MSDGAVGGDLSLAALDAPEHFAQEVDETLDSRDHDVRVDAVVSARDLIESLAHGPDHGASPTRHSLTLGQITHVCPELGEEVRYFITKTSSREIERFLATAL
jgi:hypothetical protein